MAVLGATIHELAVGSSICLTIKFVTSHCCSWRRCGWVATCCDWVVVFNRCCRISSLLGGKLNSDEYLHDIHNFWLTWVNVGMTSPSVSCHKTSNVRLRYPTPSWLPWQRGLTSSASCWRWFWRSPTRFNTQQYGDGSKFSLKSLVNGFLFPQGW